MSLLPINNHFVSSPWIPREKFDSTVDANCYFCFSSSVMYRCKICDVFVCEECCFLPRGEPRHWLHPQHPLSMNVDHAAEKSVCDGCHCVLWCHVYYKCEQCVFRLCVDCFRSSRTSRRPFRWGKEKKLHSHYSHVHDLNRCRFREDIKDCKCVICEDRMWGVGYACLKCNHFVHDSCLDTSQVIEEHPLHSSHSLKRRNYRNRDLYGYRSCVVCSFNLDGNQYPFCCKECEFSLHYQCAYFTARTTVKLVCHEHSLCYLPKSHEVFATSGFAREHVLRCMQCKKIFLLKSLDLPPKFNHFAHHHTLTLKNTSYVYASKEYYCDICEATRDAHIPTYCCPQCNFFAHIECVLSKEEHIPRALLTNEDTKADVKPPDDPSDKQISHLIHNHPLGFQTNVKDKLCRMCLLKINGRAYKCKISCHDDRFWVHERCAMLPEELEHPLHPNHNLSLTTRYRGYSLSLRVCCLCRQLIETFSFSCRTCVDFVIDIKCMFLKEGDDALFDPKGNPITLKSPVHLHELNLAILPTHTGFAYFTCCICSHYIEAGGLAYYCLRDFCNVMFHITCLEWPSVIESHPLHPPHRLKLTNTVYWGISGRMECLACLEITWGFSIGFYQCEMHPRCKVFLHIQCGSSLGRFLQDKHHDHHLDYVNNPPFHEHSNTCTLCGEKTEASFYRCVECKHYFHLRCLRLPRIAKHKRHLHALTFRDSTNRGGLYCDICEEPRDYEWPVYCCEDCDFVTHVECIASQENASNVTVEEIEDDG